MQGKVKLNILEYVSNDLTFGEPAQGAYQRWAAVELLWGEIELGREIDKIH